MVARATRQQSTAQAAEVAVVALARRSYIKLIKSLIYSTLSLVKRARAERVRQRELRALTPQ